MSSWKSDPLYRLIFGEVKSLWDLLQTDARHLGPPPEAIRVEERLSTDWEGEDGPTIKDVWIYDQFGLRLFPALRRVPHDAGERRGDAWQFALIHFAISEDRSQVALGYDFGPTRHHDMGYDIEGSGEQRSLRMVEGSLSGSY